MATNENDGPLTKLNKLLGIKNDLPVIEAVKRIEERPVSLNAELFFKMAPAPELMSDTGIHALEQFKGTPDYRYEFHGTFRGVQQWTCWDHNTYDGDESDIGSGESKEMALADLLEKTTPDDSDPKPRAGYTVHTSPYDPPEVRDVVDRSEDDDINFDSDLEDRP